MNLIDLGLSDDADISQPPTPAKENKPTLEVPTPKNIVLEDMPSVGPDGNPVTPKHHAAKYANQAQVQGTSEPRAEKRKLAATEDMGPGGHAGGEDYMSAATETSDMLTNSGAEENVHNRKG